MNICHRTICSQSKPPTAGAHQLPEPRVIHGGVNIGELVVDCLHQPPQRLVKASRHLFDGDAGNVAVDIDGRLFQRSRQIQLGVLAAGTHLLPLGVLNVLIFNRPRRGALLQIFLDLQIRLQLAPKGAVIGQDNENFPVLTGFYPQGAVVQSAVVP